MFDVVVIGSGPAGYVSAIRASQLGLKTLCVEQSIDEKGKLNLGGTCLNVGCIPSKALLDSSQRYYEANKNLGDHGIVVGDLKLDLKSMMKRKDDIVSKLTGGINGLFAANKVQSISGKGKVVSNNIVEVTKTDGSIENIETKNIILATGSKPIEIPSASFSENIVDSTGALSFKKLPKTVGIVGAGIIGLELGSVWSRLGSEVTLLEALDDFLPIADPDISNDETMLRYYGSKGDSFLTEFYPPLYLFILKFFFKVFGYIDDYGRVLSLIFGVLTIPLSMFLTEYLDKGKKFIIYDMRNIYTPAKMSKNGIKYFGIGR